MATVSIIGTSGRAGNITKEKYIKMIQASIVYLRSLCLDSIVLVSIVLVSGGQRVFPSTYKES